MIDEKKARQREYSRRYAQSTKGKVTRKRLNDSDNVKAMKARHRAEGGSKASYERNKDWYTNHDLIKRYGITLDEYNTMLDQQRGVCYVCGGVNSNGRRLSVDHNHETGEVRKLLCHPCNASLGSLREDISVLENMINYIKEHT